MKDDDISRAMSNCDFHFHLATAQTVGRTFWEGRRESLDLTLDFWEGTRGGNQGESLLTAPTGSDFLSDFPLCFPLFPNLLCSF